MAKKEKNVKKEFNYEETKKRMDKYYKAQEGEKKGKRLVLSLIGASVLIFVILLVVVLKLNGVGKTIVFTTDESGSVSTSVADSEDVSGQNLAEIIAD
ncbi:MAG: hypothetical protein J6L62_03515 [Clostridia bacterium]|nr:hypothetical protein [Clostridia bacterium]